jgi:demethylmenaquinone methyltransferase / 2-methoxy-6-polyprenyl-1,4-benzoquinol methylase
MEEDPGLKGTALELFDGLAPSYEAVLDAATLFQDRRWKKWAVAEVGAREDDLVLDVGCGTLLLAEWLRGSGCRVVGMDLTMRMIRAGISKRLPNVPLLLRGDAESLPFPDESFDAVASCYVAKYVDPQKFAEELARVVKPGGKVVVYDFVRPVGAFCLPLEFYLHGVIGAAGRALTAAGKDSSYTFKNLPWIVDGAHWNRGWAGRMGRLGFGDACSTTLGGGIVWAYSGVKRG